MADYFRTLSQGEGGVWLYGQMGQGQLPATRFPKGPIDGSFSADSAKAKLAALQANPVLAGNSPGWKSQFMSGGGLKITAIPGQSGYHYGDVDIADQPDKPSDPGIRESNASDSYGNVIPISMGRRRIPATIIQSTALTTALVGGREYDVVYQIPIFEDKSTDEPDTTTRVTTNIRGRPNPSDPPPECGDDPCDPEEQIGGITSFDLFTATCDSEGTFGPNIYGGKFATKASATVVASGLGAPYTKAWVIQQPENAEVYTTGGEACLL